MSKLQLAYNLLKKKKKKTYQKYMRQQQRKQSCMDTVIHYVTDTQNKNFNSCTTSFNNLFHCNVGYKKKKRRKEKNNIGRGRFNITNLLYKES